MRYNARIGSSRIARRASTRQAAGATADRKSGTAEYLRDVWGTASNDVYAVGWNSTILHYDGTGWSQLTSRTDVWLEGVWGTASGDVYAVGRYGIILRGSR
jgi:hypothetical protein